MSVVEEEPQAGHEAGQEVGGDVVLLARQPILETSGKVHGHELLFRRADGSGWPIDDENAATAQVLVAAFADLSLSAVTSGTRAWINTPASFLLETDLDVLPADRVVLEVIERDQVGPELVERVRQLVGLGYAIALDDFRWRDDNEALIDLATYVKLDLRDLGLAGVAEHTRLLADRDVRIVAEKVETRDERDACLRLGLGLFQGYFFEKPYIVRGRAAPTSSLSRLQTAASITAESTFEDIERLVKTDPGLSMRVLRYINSASVSSRSEVASLRQALMMLGANTVRQWLLLVLMGDLGIARPAVLTAGLVRARLCETLARQARVSPDSAFIVGLLSVCDALLDTPLEEIIPSLSLSDELKAAIINREGRLGMVLETAVLLERGDIEGTPKFAEAFVGALQWAAEQVGELGGGDAPVADAA